MAEKKADQPTVQDDLLSKFLGEVERLPKAILEGMLRQTDDEDEKAVIQSFAGPFENQISELSGFVRERAQRLSRHQEQESRRVLILSSAVSVAASGSALAANLASPVAKIGLAAIVEEIKKIIRMLLEAFGISLPKWLNTLLLLIDEILKFLLSVGSPRLASTLSRMEQDYLRELAELSRLQREDQLRSELNGDDDAEHS